MVSAIITTYKRPPEIVKRAAQSILNQTYKDIELIIVDDSPSSYELRNEVKESVISLDPNIIYIQHEKNSGACVARNTGLNCANGEFVAFLDDDDVWLPEKIEKQLKVIKTDPEIALVYCGRNTYYEKENRIVTQKVKFKRGYIFDELFIENFIGSTSFPLIRKDALIKIGGFNEIMPASQDYETWLRIAKEYKIDYTKEPLVCYYVHEGEQITKSVDKKIQALEYINEFQSDYLLNHRKIYSIRLLKIAKLFISSDIKKAKNKFKEAFFLYPFIHIRLLTTFIRIYIFPKIKN